VPSMLWPGLRKPAEEPDVSCNIPGRPEVRACLIRPSPAMNSRRFTLAIGINLTTTTNRLTVRHVRSSFPAL
jgi:hypothetical protein